MNVITPSEFGRAGAPGGAHERISFHRSELSIILGVYGRFVAAGEWRDYAMDFLPDAAVFSVYRRATETPLFRIEKRPKLAAKQGAYSVLGHDGRVLKRSKDLAQVMRIFDAKLLRIVE